MAGKETPIPAAIWEQVHRYFNRDDLKWWAAAESLAARPYTRVYEWLASRYRVHIGTNDDSAGDWFILADHPDEITVSLSWVGPWAYVWSRVDGLPRADPEIDSYLASEGFTYLGVELLSALVDHWGEANAAPLYSFLFQSETDLPWDLYASRDDARADGVGD